MQAQAQGMLKQVLCFNKPAGFNHTNAISALRDTLAAMGPRKGFTVTMDEDGSHFTPTELAKYQVVVLNNVTGIGNALSGAQLAAFSAWMQAGGGAVGFHGAMDHGDHWAWYTQNMAFTKFASHSSWGSKDTAKVKTDAEGNKLEYAGILSVLPKVPWGWHDEWYSFTINPRPSVDVLMTIDETTFTPNPAMGDHPITWAVHLPPGPTGKQGRYFYTVRGHEKQSYDDQTTRDMIYEALRWAAGETTVGIAAPAGSGSFHAGLDATVQGKSLSVRVTGAGRHHLEIFGLDGSRFASREGYGSADYAFPVPEKSGIYLVKAQTVNGSMTKRIHIIN